MDHQELQNLETFLDLKEAWDDLDSLDLLAAMVRNDLPLSLSFYL
jgi:hypothetical protein